jgi:hypothetical protein
MSLAIGRRRAKTAGVGSPRDQLELALLALVALAGATVAFLGLRHPARQVS